MNNVFISADIPQTIQLAMTPVFFLAGIGAFMSVIAGRLARVVDRARHLENVLPGSAVTDRLRHIEELRTLERRMGLASRAISLCTASGLAICLLIITTFAELLVRINLSNIVAVLFVAAVMLLAAGLVLFLRETRIAVAALHVREELIALGAEPEEAAGPKRG